MAGNITIVEPVDNFQKVSRFIIENERIDHLTLALYVRVLHLGKEWKLNVKGLASRLHLAESTVRRCIVTLENEGYIRRVPVRDEVSGKMHGWDYFVYAEPVQEDQKTALSKNRNTVETAIRSTPQDGMDRNTEKRQGLNKDLIENKDLNVSKDPKNINSAGFDFRREVIGLGVPAALVDDWLKVRHGKRLTNTRTAFDAIAREIAKSGRPAEECVRFVVERSWGGFKAEWLVNDNPGSTRTAPVQQAQPWRGETLAEHWARVDKELAEMIPGYGQRTDNQ